MLWISTLALAAPFASPADSPVVDPMRYLVACMGVLGLLAVGLFALRKLVMGAQRTRAAGRSLAVLDQLHLGGSKRLTVVRCYDRQFVLGVGDKEIAVVAELDVDQAVPPLPERGAGSAQPANAQPAEQAQLQAQPAAREAFQGLLQRAQKLADAIVPPRRNKSGDVELPVTTVQPKRAVSAQRSGKQAERSAQAGAAGAAEPTPEVKAKVARELLAKLGPDHELLGAVRAAADSAPQRKRAAQRDSQHRGGGLQPRGGGLQPRGGEVEPQRKARAQRRGAPAERPQAQPARPAQAEQPATDEGWLG